MEGEFGKQFENFLDLSNIEFNINIDSFEIYKKAGSTLWNVATRKSVKLQ